MQNENNNKKTSQEESGNIALESCSSYLSKCVTPKIRTLFRCLTPMFSGGLETPQYPGPVVTCQGSPSWRRVLAGRCLTHLSGSDAHILLGGVLSAAQTGLALVPTLWLYGHVAMVSVSVKWGLSPHRALHKGFVKGIIHFYFGLNSCCWGKFPREAFRCLLGLWLRWLFTLWGFPGSSGRRQILGLTLNGLTADSGGRRVFTAT